MITLKLTDKQALLIASLLAQTSCGDCGDEPFEALTEHLGTYKGGTQLLPINAWNRETNERQLLSGYNDFLIEVEGTK